MQTVPVYEWLVAGIVVGLGTQVEFDHWTTEGTMEDTTRGKVVCQEPASEDARRQAAWAQVAA